MAIDSVVVLVGSKNDNLDNIGGILSGNIPFERATSIEEAVRKVIVQIHRRNARHAPIVDIVGHAVEGQFIFGTKDVLSSCSNSYYALEPLRPLIRPLDPNDKDEKWGLRLIGCDLSSTDRGHPYGRDNGTVLQFALAWFLQVPVWASSTAIFANDFRNADYRVPFGRLHEVSTGNSPKIPLRQTNEELVAALRAIFDAAKKPPQVAAPSGLQHEADFPDFYEFDLTNPVDASELFAEIPEKNRIQIPKYARAALGKAYKIFGGQMLLAVPSDGPRVAYFRARSAPAK